MCFLCAYYCLRYEYSSDPKDKVRPTVSKVHIDTQDDLNVNVSVANANMLLEAYSSWTNLSKIEAGNKKRKFQVSMFVNWCVNAGLCHFTDFCFEITV
jgi:hypothetical protein